MEFARRAWTWMSCTTLAMGTLLLLPTAWAQEADSPIVELVKPGEENGPKEKEPPKDTSGDKLIVEAHGKTKSAKSISDYTTIISLCHQGIRLGVSEESNMYAKRLMAWSYNRRGQILADQGHDTVAMADFQAAVHNDKTRWRALHNRGVSYAMMGQFHQAITDFNRTIEINPLFPNAYFNRAEVRYELGQFRAGIKDYSRAIKLAPEDSSYYNSRGHAYYRLGDIREALQDYTLALRVDPQNAEALTNRGDLYTDLGYYEKAVTDYQGAVRSAPESDRAYQSAAWLMATCPETKWRSTDGALEAAAKAIELGGNGDPRYLDTLAAAQANAGNYATAQRILQRAIQVADKSAAGHYRARLALYEKQRPYRLKPLSLEEMVAKRKKLTAEQQATYDEKPKRR